jgi:signal transduction histidine kinase
MRAVSEANKKLNLLSGITFQDVQNQTVVLNGLIQRARHDSSRAASMESLACMQHAIEKIQSFINFAREYQSAGDNPPSWRRLDECLRDLVSDFESKYIHLDMAVDEWEILSDAMLSRVFYNLIDNTAHHGQKATKVRMSAQERDGTLIISYEDNGVGVPTDQKGAIFEPKQGNDRPHGLMMARAILAITGITIEEKGVPGQGALFEIKVPAAAYRRYAPLGNN